MIASVASKINFYQRDNASSVKELKESLKVLTENKEIEKSQPLFICITSEYTTTKSKNNNQSGEIRRDVNTVERNPVLCCVCAVEGKINQLFFFFLLRNYQLFSISNSFANVQAGEKTMATWSLSQEIVECGPISLRE